MKDVINERKPKHQPVPASLQITTTSQNFKTPTQLSDIEFKSEPDEQVTFSLKKEITKSDYSDLIKGKIKGVVKRTASESGSN